MPDFVTVTFSPSGSRVEVASGTLLIDAARAAGVLLPATCASRGVCGACAVRVLAGELEPPDDVEAAAIVRARSAVRLACRARVTGPVTVAPLATAAASSVVQNPGEAVFAGVDLGTTTASAQLLAADGTVVGTSVVPNRQAYWGGDVLSRLGAAVAGSGDAIRDAARDTVRDALALAAAGRVLRLRRVVIAGNTAMSALVAGVDVSSLATAPFVAPETPDALLFDLGTDVKSEEVLLAPSLASFVGGDVLAGLIATLPDTDTAPLLFVDVGTNAEIVVMTHETSWVASAAAGPAFEGAGIECGMSAVPGAVTGVRFADGVLHLDVVDNVPPSGIAGSGLVSTIAILLDTGHLSADGLLSPEGPLSAHFDRDERGVLSIRLDHDGRVWVSQLDVRALQLAKGAVRAGISQVLAAAGVSAAEITSCVVAGAFGAALNERDLLAIGMVPNELAGHITHPGNTSLAGASTLARNPEAGERVRERLGAIRHVELASDPGFSAALMASVTLAP